MTDTLSGPAPAPAGEPKQAGLWHRLYHGETTFDFVGRRRIGFAISGLLIVLSLISLAWRGLNYGIDFEGGVAWEVNATSVSEDQVASILEDNGIAAGDAKIQTLSSASGERLRVQVGTQPTEVQSAVRQDLAEAAGGHLAGREPELGERLVGIGDHRQGHPCPRRVLRRHHPLHHAPLRVEDGHRQPARGLPRRAHQRRRLLA